MVTIAWLKAQCKARSIDWAAYEKEVWRIWTNRSDGAHPPSKDSYEDTQLNVLMEWDECNVEGERMSGIPEERKELAIKRLMAASCVIRTKEISEDILIVLLEIDILKDEIKRLTEEAKV